MHDARTRERAGPLNWLTDIEQTHCMRRLNVVRSPTGQSSMEGQSRSSFPTLNFLLSPGVSCASISSTTFCSRRQGSKWNSAIPLFLATPLTAATPNLCKTVCGTPNCRGEQWTVDSTEWLMLRYVPYVNPTWQICNYNVRQMALSKDRRINDIAVATCGTATQWQGLKYTPSTHVKHTSSNKVVVTVTITQCQPTVKPQCTLANFPRPSWSLWQAHSSREGLVHYIDSVLVWDTTLPLPAVYRLFRSACSQLIILSCTRLHFLKIKNTQFTNASILLG